MFAPGQNTPGHYNIWQGFAVQANPGDCGLYLKHLRDNVAQGNTEIYQYIIHWMAQTVQFPSHRPGVSIVLRGKQGTGKGVTCVEFGKLFGTHFVHVQHSRHLVGNFNAHLHQAIVVFADEAYGAGDRASEGALKALITEEQLPIEFKGKDVMYVKNHVRLLMASNHDWVVPAGLEERRFFVVDVGEAHMQDIPYFAAIADQMDHGGREALLHHLINVDLAGVDLREFPQTAALMENKLLSMSPVEKFWYEKLWAGSLQEDVEWWARYVVRDQLHEEYVKHAQKSGQNRKGTQTELGIALNKLVPGLHGSTETIGGTRVATWEFPDLDTCRKAFDKITKYKHPWPQESCAIKIDLKAPHL